MKKIKDELMCGPESLWVGRAHQTGAKTKPTTRPFQKRVRAKLGLLKLGLSLKRALDPKLFEDP